MTTECTRPDPTRITSVPSLPTSLADGDGMGTNWFGELVQRGIVRDNARHLVTDFAADRIAQAVAYFDAQRTGTVGPGVLVRAIREGRQPQRARTTSLEAQRSYGHDVTAWLQVKFPDLCDPAPHPAAVAAVIRLHHQHGKGSLTAAAHGPAIRQAVAAFDTRYTQPSTPTKGAAT